MEKLIKKALVVSVVALGFTGCGQPPEVSKPFNANEKEIRTIKGYQYYLPKDADKNFLAIVGKMDENKVKKDKRNFYHVAHCKQGDAFWVSKQVVQSSNQERTKSKKVDVLFNSVLKKEAGCVSPVGGYR